MLIPAKNWINNIGLNVASYILNHVRNTGWDDSPSWGPRTGYFDYNCASIWFEIDGILSSYKPISGRTLRLRFHRFEEDVEEKYGIGTHSNDKTGAEGEDIHLTVSLCLKWFDHRATLDDNPNAEQMRGE